MAGAGGAAGGGGGGCAAGEQRGGGAAAAAGGGAARGALTAATRALTAAEAGCESSHCESVQVTGSSILLAGDRWWQLTHHASRALLATRREWRSVAARVSPPASGGYIAGPGARLEPEPEPEPLSLSLRRRLRLGPGALVARQVGREFLLQVLLDLERRLVFDVEARRALLVLYRHTQPTRQRSADIRERSARHNSDGAEGKRREEGGGGQADTWSLQVSAVPSR